MFWSYRISIIPEQTKVPCKADKDEFLNVVKKLASLKIKTKKENDPQNNPATATVVNVGVFFLHFNETEKNENLSYKILLTPNKPQTFLGGCLNVLSVFLG